MNYLQNHIWCSESNWGGEYDCRHSVFFNCYDKESDLDDWNAVIDEGADKFVNEEQLNLFANILRKNGQKVNLDDIRENYEQPVPNLKPEVLQWLQNNVADRPKVGYDGHIKGWCIGAVAYRATSTISFNVFFHRRKDAMAFIKRWSKWKKPVFYTQYFTDVRKKLDLSTLKYTKR